MASKIKIKRSSVAGRVPTTSDIDVGELAINTKDQKLYSSNGSAVFQLAYASNGAVQVTTATVKNLTQNDTVVTNVTSYANSVVDNSMLATKASWTALTSTNTALRTLISDRLQVANAASLYATKASPTTSGLLAHTGRATISTNLTVSGNTAVVGLKANNSLGTSGQFLRSDGSKAYWDALPPSTQYLQVSNAATIYATKSNPTTSGLLAHTGRATISTNLIVSGNTTIVGLNANNTFGTTGQVLKTNGTSVYWGVGGGSASGANAIVTRAKVSDLNVNSYVITSVSGVYVNPNNMVSLTTKRFDSLVGSDTVVTAAQAVSSSNYLQVANATTLLATKIGNNVTTTLQTYNIIPATTNTYSLGSSSKRWKDLWLSGNTLYLGSAILRSSQSKLSVVGSGVLVSNTYLTSTYATKASPTTSGLLAHTGRATISTNLAVTGNTTLSGTLVANNTAGTAGYYLRTSGTGIYWSPISAGSTTQYLQVANAVATYATKSNPTTSGLLAHTGRATISTNLAVSGNATVSGTMTATGIVSGSELTSTLASGDEGGQINLTKPPNGTLSGGITIDAYQNRLRFFEQGGSARGAYIDLSASSGGVADNLFIGPTAYGAVGTYLWAFSSASTVPGGTQAGSTLTPAGEAYDGQPLISGYGVTGTWRVMGNGTGGQTTLYLRVA